MNNQSNYKKNSTHRFQANVSLDVSLNYSFGFTNAAESSTESTTNTASKPKAKLAPMSKCHVCQWESRAMVCLGCGHDRLKCEVCTGTKGGKEEEKKSG
ncbi:hypothetical protein BU24DRAFT_422099 [Aaosphaeria arxii CBS 175.79]|uniref:Uncharacterized protein n=1 Tax=Aaosphaeria arxii CBS 175.79 TaxID=1450172 RepID=A0A6A5XSW5_9PLEO|nr:uncharacterized protein BU24DRAFT_422099 [Aaosphaeria arxii CBS 175.79]KAF2015780.1 hypothetical protein BU24DRAFT_422099 [Aaosphaeria arxii CBS 175.79]